MASEHKRSGWVGGVPEKGEAWTEHKPYPKNVPGDFYVEDGCCTMCEAPFAEAPGLFGVDEYTSNDSPVPSAHCYIKQQPGTPEQVEQMIWAIHCAELSCIRYRGNNRHVQLQIVESGMGHVCDFLPTDLQVMADQLQEKKRIDRASLSGRLERLWRRIRFWFTWDWVQAIRKRDKP